MAELTPEEFLENIMIPEKSSDHICWNCTGLKPVLKGSKFPPADIIGWCKKIHWPHYWCVADFNVVKKCYAFEDKKKVGPMNERKLTDLVTRVVRRFESKTGYPVTQNARKQLIKPGLDHLQKVNSDLKVGRINVKSLETTLYKVLENAMSIVKDLDLILIDEHEIKQSMKRYCPYLFWC